MVRDNYSLIGRNTGFRVSIGTETETEIGDLDNLATA